MARIEKAVCRCSMVSLPEQTSAFAMPYSQLTIDSRSALKRFSHRRRFLKTVQLLALADGQTVLDYGCGDGHLLSLVARRWPHCRLVGYDPIPSQLQELEGVARDVPIEAIASTSGLAQASFDRIACCEVLEHLIAGEQRRVLADIHRLLKPDGRLVITVPLEVGPASVAKNLARWAIGQGNDGLCIRNAWRAFWGLRSSRGEQGAYISSHVGFRHWELHDLFREGGFEVLRRAWSPLPWTGPLLNSQVLYVLRIAK
ncbi:MAG: class I SAM-dependent methyltransferase [Planctomycetaceae bacterium]|nr:class I SAM-dependent methyltransferase [Planctomycetaceae bacterium]